MASADVAHPGRRSRAQLNLSTWQVDKLRFRDAMRKAEPQTHSDC